jgi:hypothetical protein
MHVADFLDTKLKEMKDRLGELRPLVDEYRRLDGAIAALEGRAPRGDGGTPARGRPRGGGASGGGTAGTRRRGRPRGGEGTRGAEALQIVKEQPGITIPELAERMGIKQNYLYRVMPGLQKEGQVVKQGRGWHAA